MRVLPRARLVCDLPRRDCGFPRAGEADLGSRRPRRLTGEGVSRRPRRRATGVGEAGDSPLAAFTLWGVVVLDFVGLTILPENDIT